MINLVVLEGRLVKDVEVRYTSNEVAIGNFTIAVNRTFKNAYGEYDADFIECVLFKEQAENIQKHVHKGDLISVRGRLQKRSYEDKDGNKRYITEVVVERVNYFALRNQEDTEVFKTETPNEENPYKDMSIKVESDQSIVISDDELPF